MVLQRRRLGRARDHPQQVVALELLEVEAPGVGIARELVAALLEREQDRPLAAVRAARSDYLCSSNARIARAMMPSRLPADA